jgi:Tfp pilus assembly protein PilO
MIDNNTVLYILAILFFIYVMFFHVKEKLDNTDLSSYTEEQLRLTINKAKRSQEALVNLEKIQDPPEFIKKRINEMNNDIKNGELAKEVLVSRNLVV